MKKALGSVLTMFTVLAALLIGGAAAAQANTPTSNCKNGAVGLVNAVICEIDVDDNDVLDGNDIKVEILNYVANNNELSDIANDLDVANVDIDDVTVIKNLVIGDINVDPSVIIVLPCGCSH